MRKFCRAALLVSAGLFRMCLAQFEQGSIVGQVNDPQKCSDRGSSRADSQQHDERKP